MILLLFLPADFSGFSGLATYSFTRVTYAFAFIRLRFAQAADLCCNFTNQLLVDAENAEPGSFGCRIDAIDGKRNSLGRLDFDRMRVPDLNDQALAHFRGPIANSMNF